MEKFFPFPYHLCQPDGEKSCGACCGLYNWEDHSRATLRALLQSRTARFFSQGRHLNDNPSDCGDGPVLGNPKLLETIYNCEFLGFIDLEEKKVGCLLHPAVHQGADLRERSFYGLELCAGHFCPSYTYLAKIEQAAVIAVVRDWYLYGLVITDIDLVKEFFHHVHNRLGETVHPERLSDPRVQDALRDFFQLKESWKFASREHRLGKYYFSQAEYQIARIEYENNWRIKPSRFDKILVSLSSAFSSREDVWEAESIIEERVAGFVDSYRVASF